MDVLKGQCCCFCEQVIHNGDTGSSILPQLQVGDTVTQANGAIVGPLFGSEVDLGRQATKITLSQESTIVKITHSRTPSTGSHNDTEYSFFHGGVLIGGGTGDLTTQLSQAPQPALRPIRHEEAEGKLI